MNGKEMRHCKNMFWERFWGIGIFPKEVIQMGKRGKSNHSQGLHNFSTLVWLEFVGWMLFLVQSQYFCVITC